MQRKRVATGKRWIRIDNKQVVNVHCGTTCKSKHRRRPTRKRTVRKCCFTDDVCGKIIQKCDGVSTTYWHSSTVLPTGTIRITNESQCEMTAFIRHGDDVTVFAVQSGQQVSFTGTRLTELRIQCESAERHDSTCTGTYAMALHYEM